MTCPTWKNIVVASLMLGVCILWFGDYVSAEEGVIVVDATGETLRLLNSPQRIVSLNPDFTENIIALGAGKSLVGITDFCRYSDETHSPARLGGLWQPNLERIVTLKPDLVLATREGNQPGVVSTLRDMNIPVYVSGQASSFQDYFDLLRQLGIILDREKKAGVLIGGFREQIDNLRSKAYEAHPVSVFLQIGIKPLITINNDTLIGEMIEISGGRNVTAELPSRYPSISREQVLLDNPEVIIIAVMGSEAQAGKAYWENFSELEAVRNKRVKIINPDLICRLGPGLREGLSLIESFIQEGRENSKR